MNKKLKIIKSSVRDIKFLYNLYNQGVKENIFNTKREIKFEDHKIWYLKNEHQNIIFICKINSINIGYIRYNVLKYNKASISIIFIKKYRNRKLSSSFLKKTLSKLKKISKIKKIYAEVLKKNYISQKFFLKNNFHLNNDHKMVKKYFNSKNIVFLYRYEK